MHSVFFETIKRKRKDKVVWWFSLFYNYTDCVVKPLFNHFFKTYTVASGKNKEGYSQSYSSVG